MIVRILGDRNTPAYRAAYALISALGHTIDNGTYTCVDIAVGPLVTDIITQDQLCEHRLGTLIFHPSPLPYGRGASSIRWAYRRREPVTAATWFWIGPGKVDSGDICEQEIVKIDYSKSPREFYDGDILPTMLRTLKRVLENLANGIVRRVPQVEQYATFDRRLT